MVQEKCLPYFFHKIVVQKKQFPPGFIPLHAALFFGHFQNSHARAPTVDFLCALVYVLLNTYTNHYRSLRPVVRHQKIALFSNCPSPWRVAHIPILLYGSAHIRKNVQFGLNFQSTRRQTVVRHAPKLTLALRITQLFLSIIWHMKSVGKYPAKNEHFLAFFEASQKSTTCINRHL